MNGGLLKVRPNRKDYSLLHTFGAVEGNPSLLPDSFSIYDGRAIPNQNSLDTRFDPALSALFQGCTGETAAFDSGIQDGKLYNPQWIYANTPPKDFGGRDIRDTLQFLIDNGPEKDGVKRTAYFNCYAAGKIDDYDAARIGLWINQAEKRGVWVGSYWYWGGSPSTASLPTPSYNTSQGTLHCYLITGWNAAGLEVIPWLGQGVGDSGKFSISREIYNNLMRQPWTAAFTETKVSGQTPVPIGLQAYTDHIVYVLTQFIHSLFGI